LAEIQRLNLTDLVTAIQSHSEKLADRWLVINNKHLNLVGTHAAISNGSAPAGMGNLIVNRAPPRSARGSKTVSQTRPARWYQASRTGCARDAFHHCSCCVESGECCLDDDRGVTARLMLDFKTKAGFRKDNGDAIRKDCREFGLTAQGAGTTPARQALRSTAASSKPSRRHESHRPFWRRVSLVS
jgi:hypothetical protein